ncbi:Mobile element protein [Psychrobacter nivimaris]|jgi:IS30 family transposase|uniref:Mobile element protein n=27 Tax=Gammaproteobacteria TaxID=1236 RepID=A0A6N7C410_9GAMM|nr:MULTISPECIES: IS30 family transposase [Psychrobacter]KAF0570011.1 Mobile element protein [Psychrobacter nivimaris]|tara:strand:- start:2167 stop:3093 length:927 start_codon:yes stop_codon:yes gene_type:complete
MNYTHLSLGERYQIYALIGAEHSINFIARALNRSPSTILREIRRNKSLRGYRVNNAHKKACARRSNNALSIIADVWDWVTDKLKENWSPQQIAGVHGGLSHMSIYRYIWTNKRKGGRLWQCLRRKAKPYRQRLTAETRGRINDRVSIHERPSIVDARTRIGDWEADTIIGQHHKQAIVTLVERKTGLLKMKRVDNKTAQQVSEAMIELLKPVRLQVKTITSDNGKEFAQHKKVKQKLFSSFFFADAYASWQRGTNENTNGLIREYLPKGCDFRQVSDDEMQDIENKLNNRPRKRLGFKTPMQAFYNIN